MAELDYAYLADYVSIQDSKLTAVGASFTFARLASAPSQVGLGIGGRVRARVDEGPVTLEIKVTPPDDAYEMSYSGNLDGHPESRPYGDGVVGLLFAINVQLPVEVPGLYVFDITLQGKHVRRLAFEIELAKVP